jgi:hypothetical protein
MGKAREDDADFAIVKDEEMDEHLIEYRPEDLKTGQE